METPNVISSDQVLKDHISRKVMASVFLDRKGVLVIDYLKQGNNVTGVYYSGLVRKPREAVKEKCQGKLTHWVLLHNDSAPAHTLFPWWLCTSAALNSSLNHLILEIWLHWISKGPDI